jgi:hypothetical protein
MLSSSSPDDPVAMTISWEPASPGGANFQTQRLRVHEHTMTIERTGGYRLFAAVFLLPGLLALLVGGPYLLLDGEAAAGAFVMLWGLGFGLAGVALLRGSDRMSFDRLSGAYFSGSDYDSSRPLERSTQGRLADIHALQLLDERVIGRLHYTSYELNLVLHDGTRVNVMDHGKGPAVEDAARQLGQFLGVPVWRPRR